MIVWEPLLEASKLVITDVHDLREHRPLDALGQRRSRQWSFVAPELFMLELHDEVFQVHVGDGIALGRGIAELKWLNEVVGMVSSDLPVEEYTENSPEVSLCALILVDDVELKVKEFTTNGMLGGRVEVELNRIEQADVTICSCQLQESIKEVHLQTGTSVP